MQKEEEKKGDAEGLELLRRWPCWSWTEEMKAMRVRATRTGGSLDLNRIDWRNGKAGGEERRESGRSRPEICEAVAELFAGAENNCTNLRPSLRSKQHANFPTRTFPCAATALQQLKSKWQGKRSF
ncbi:unnamed protein product [Linum trigynum]|uniref:Uncharacterized protein n=1 Tax=Linum trigynum TaxID=586398 RepID=A0AAV2F2P3_9ROSI